MELFNTVHFKNHLTTKKGGNDQMNKIKNKMIALFIIGVSLILPFSYSEAEENKPTCDASLTLISQYIWRGYEQSRDSLIIQPSITIGYDGFSANVWQSIDTDPYNSDTENLYETDFTLSYDTEINDVSLGAGWIWYVLPDSEYDSQELYVTAGLDTFLNPTITIYREFYHAPSTYITLGISHSLELGWMNSTLDLGLQGSYLISNDSGAYPDPDDPEDEYNNFHDGLLSAELNVPVNKYITVTPAIYWSFPLCDDAADDMKQWAKGNLNHNGKDNFLYGGITVSLSF